MLPHHFLFSIPIRPTRADSLIHDAVESDHETWFIWAMYSTFVHCHFGMYEIIIIEASSRVSRLVLWCYGITTRSLWSLLKWDTLMIEQNWVICWCYWRCKLLIIRFNACMRSCTTDSSGLKRHFCTTRKCMIWGTVMTFWYDESFLPTADEFFEKDSHLHQKFFICAITRSSNTAHRLWNRDCKGTFLLPLVIIE